MDKEVLREIWHGQLPLCFKLHPDDVSGMHRPEPYYMMVPRVSYFPLVLDRVIKYFNRFMDQNKEAINDMWLDYDGQPIKWQHPIGLSWDLFGSHYDLPWKLVLHFSEFPAKELVRCNTKSSIEASFISSIKEADALKHKGIVIKNMVKKDHNQLWSSLVNDKFDQFWLVNQKLMDRMDNELFRYIPFRLYLPDYTYVQKIIKPCTTERQIFHTFASTSSDNKTNRLNPTHIPSSVYSDTDVMTNISHKCNHKPDGKHRCSTILDLIRVCFSNRMEDLISGDTPRESMKLGEHKESVETGGGDITTIERRESISKQSVQTDTGDPDEESEEKEAQETKLCAPAKTSSETSDQLELIDVRSFKYRFMSHGVEIPFDTPLQWLSEHFSYPDNFLHICAVIKDNVTCS